MKKLFLTVKEFTSDLTKNNVPFHAAAGAFFSFVSLVPFVAIIAAIIPYTGLEKDALLRYISEYIPQALEIIIAEIIDDIYFRSDLVLPIAIIIAIWSASRAFSALIRGIEVICGKSSFASYFKRKLLACLYTVALIAAMLLVMLLLVFGGRFARLVQAEVPLVSPFVALVIKLRFLIVLLFLTLVFISVYRWVPGMKLGYGSLIPGAVAASCSWLLFTWLFSLFLGIFDSYSTYGSLATIVICLMWMYWCMYIILLGAQLNVFLHKPKAGDKPREKAE